MTTDQAIKILNGAIKKPNTIDGYLGQALTMAIYALKNHPEIIRCKDCRWKQGSECVRFSDVMPLPDDFCSRAELRGNRNDRNQERTIYKIAQK